MLWIQDNALQFIVKSKKSRFIPSNSIFIQVQSSTSSNVQTKSWRENIFLKNTRNNSFQRAFSLQKYSTCHYKSLKPKTTQNYIILPRVDSWSTVDFLVKTLDQSQPLLLNTNPIFLHWQVIPYLYVSPKHSSVQIAPWRNLESWTLCFIPLDQCQVLSTSPAKITYKMRKKPWLHSLHHTHQAIVPSIQKKRKQIFMLVTSYLKECNWLHLLSHHLAYQKS